MQFAQFERAARGLWNEIPAEYKEGVDGLIVDESLKEHPNRAGIYTMGECVTEDYPSQYGGPDTTRSAVVLYYGSFKAVAEDEQSFDWDAEIHETVMHELQHHLESLADESGLEDVDYAVEENFKRVDGEPFDPLFYRAGERVDEDTFRVEIDSFVEVIRKDGESFEFEIEEDTVRYVVTVPESSADVLYAYVANVHATGEGDLCIVRVRQRGILATLRSAFGGGLSVEEVDVMAKVIP